MGSISRGYVLTWNWCGIGSRHIYSIDVYMQWVTVKGCLLEDPENRGR
jgi:hypothetical protein